jgi:probable HAF family extracellular repeat protein
MIMAWVVPLIPALASAPSVRADYFTITDLGGGFGGGYCVPAGINENGQVAGYSLTGQGDYHAFLYSSGAMQDLGAFGGSQPYQSNAYGINNSGQVVGYATTNDNTVHAFLYSGGRMQDIGTAPGAGYSIARGVNSSGQITGDSYGIGIGEHGFLYSNGRMQDLGILPDGDNWWTAKGINSSGQIIASPTDPQTGQHSFLYTNGAMQDLGSLGAGSCAFGINSIGNVVGWSYYDHTVNGHAGGAFFWSNGVMHDLNELIDPSSNWFLSMATAINDNGQIVGIGSNPSGQIDAFLLTPSAGGGGGPGDGGSGGPGDGGSGGPGDGGSGGGAETVPEPSIFIGLSGLAAMGLVMAWRRRK